MRIGLGRKRMSQEQYPGLPLGTHLTHVLAWGRRAIGSALTPHLLPSSCSLLLSSAVGRAPEIHWPSFVSPRIDSRSISSMVLPSEDSSLSKPNLSISLNLNEENKKSSWPSWEQTLDITDLQSGLTTPGACLPCWSAFLLSPWQMTPMGLFCSWMMGKQRVINDSQRCWLWQFSINKKSEPPIFFFFFE